MYLKRNSFCFLIILCGNLFSQKVGIGSTQFVPVSSLDVKGNMTIGSTYGGTNAAPADGLIVEGNVGIGSVNPGFSLDVNGHTNIATAKGYWIGGNKVLFIDGTNNLYCGVGTAASLTTGNNNTFVGYMAGNVVAGGQKNTLIGANAGTLLTSGSFNTYIGYNAGASNLTANGNVFIGQWAGYSHTSGEDNTFIGNSAGTSENNTYRNVFVGKNAGLKCAQSDNVFIGFQSGVNATAVTQSVFIGEGVMGNNAGASTTTATGVFIGSRAAYSKKTGQGTYIGSYVAYNDTSGTQNTIIGRTAANSNISGSYNVFLGEQVAGSNTTGSSNVVIGFSAGHYNTSGSQNIFIGRNTMTGGAARAINNSVVIGYSAGTNCSADNNILIGNSANANAGVSNSLALGTSAVVTTNNTFIFGTAAVQSVGFNGAVPNPAANAFVLGTDATNGNGAGCTIAGAWFNGSDKNIKEDFREIDGKELLKKISMLTITNWKYKGEAETVRHIGPMAQDFRTLFNVGHDDKTISTIDPSGISLAAIKELYKMMEEQAREIAVLKNELQQLKK